ncbi:MAG TPA: NAD(P)-binding domain-containing protein [Thermoanaerobaculia bacterium]|nr:NAD(P)-binding domain-containing protein [Thermoanaerobaculia bacterium]
MKRAAIIGAGPIGIELAVAFQRAGIDSIHFDAAQIGATMQWYPLEMVFHSGAERLAIAGVPIQVPDQQKIKREEFLAYLRAVVMQFGLQIRTYERVVKVDTPGYSRRQPTVIPSVVEGPGRVGHEECASRPAHPGPSTHARDDTGGFTLQTTKGSYDVSEIVLAIGAMHVPKLLNIPGEELPHVSHYFRDPHTYFNTDLLVVGGRNSAVEAAVRCQRAGAHVTVAYRQDDFDPKSVKFWLLPEIRAMIRDGLVRFLPRTWPTGIREGSVLLNTGETLPADFVLALTGYRQDTTLFEMLGFDLQGADRKPLLDESTMETNVPGVFVAGTAIAGSPAERVSIIVEDCHVHVPRIVAAIAKRHARA